MYCLCWGRRCVRSRLYGGVGPDPETGSRVGRQANGCHYVVLDPLEIQTRLERRSSTSFTCASLPNLHALIYLFDGLIFTHCHQLTNLLSVCYTLLPPHTGSPRQFRATTSEETELASCVFLLCIYLPMPTIPCL